MMENRNLLFTALTGIVMILFLGNFCINVNAANSGEIGNANTPTITMEYNPETGDFGPDDRQLLYDQNYRQKEQLGLCGELENLMPKTNRIYINSNFVYNSRYVDSSFRVYRSDSRDGDYQLIYTASPGYGIVHNLSYTDQNLEWNKVYYYYITSGNKQSSKCAFWTAPSEIIINQDGNSLVSWDSVDNVSGYMITEQSSTYQGDNIFGDYVVYSEWSSVFQADNAAYKRKKKNSIVYIAPYSKHNGYYYMWGKKPTANLDDLIEESSDITNGTYNSSYNSPFGLGY